MNCPQCEKLILAEHINLETMFAKCIRCQHVFRIDQVIPKSTNEKSDIPFAIKPEKFDVLSTDSCKQISIPWYTHQILILIFFFSIWNIVSLGILFFAKESNGSHTARLFAILFLEPIGIIGIYFTIAVIFNSTTIKIDHFNLIVRHSPIPIWPGRTLSSQSIVELYIEFWAFSDSNEKNADHYSIYAIDQNGRKIKIGISYGIFESRYIVYTLNQWLGLKPSRMGVKLFE